MAPINMKNRYFFLFLFYCVKFWVICRHIVTNKMRVHNMEQYVNNMDQNIILYTQYLLFFFSNELPFTQRYWNQDSQSRIDFENITSKFVKEIF